MRPPLLRRLLDRLRGTSGASRAGGAAGVRAVTPAEEEPQGVEMPAAGAKEISFSAHPVAERDSAALEALAPEVRETVRRSLREAKGSARMTQVERSVLQDGTIAETTTERVTPLDPEVRAALEKLVEAEAGAVEQQIVVDVDGGRQVYSSIDQVPPEVRGLLGRFAEAPISRDDAEA
jgi:hypothetical protein